MKMDLQTAIDTVNAQGAQLEKIFGEVSGIKQALADAIAAGNTVPTALADAITNAGAKIQAVDDLNTDVTPV
jgi:uncharacterized protein YoxC